MMADSQLAGGPVWRESAFAFDNGCRMMGEANEIIGKLIPYWAGRPGRVSDETIRQWRLGRRDAPFWAYLGLWRRLRSQGFTAGELYGVLGFSFREEAAHE